MNERRLSMKGVDSGQPCNAAATAVGVGGLEGISTARLPDVVTLRRVKRQVRVQFKVAGGSVVACGSAT
jgi:hypothetical protein